MPFLSLRKPPRACHSLLWRHRVRSRPRSTRTLETSPSRSVPWVDPPTRPCLLALRCQAPTRSPLSSQSSQGREPRLAPVRRGSLGPTFRRIVKVRLVLSALVAVVATDISVVLHHQGSPNRPVEAAVVVSYPQPVSTPVTVRDMRHSRWFKRASRSLARTPVKPKPTPKPVVVVPTTAPTTNVQPSVSRETGTTTWDRIAACESGGNWHINTGNGYYGGLQ